MALQPRLGADSPANCLPRELVQEIATIATYTTVNEWLESNKGRIEYWRSQRQHDRNYDLLMRAQIGAIDLVRILLYTGANPNFADTNGTTSMHLAAISGNQTIIAILLAVGADHTMRAASGYYSGMTAAEVARHCGRGVLADLIEQWGSGHRSEVESE